MPEKDGFDASTDIIKLQENISKIISENRDVLKLSN